MAWKQFEDEGGDGSGDKRLLPSGNRERLVDCMEEFVKFTLMMRGKEELFADRFSERREREAKAKKLAAAEAVVAASKDNESKT
jgi:arsenic resistance protein ArsH